MIPVSSAAAQQATLVEGLHQHGFRQPEKRAIIAGMDALSFGELWRRIERFAAGLHSLGIDRGSRVALSLPNRPEFAIAYFGTHMAGCTAVPLGPTCPDLGEITSLIAASVTVTTDGSGATDSSQSCLPIGFIEDAGARRGATNAGPSLLEDAEILFTTGTTGRRKGVVLTQLAVASTAARINQVVPASPDDVEVVALPITHSFGLGRLRCMALMGHTLVLVPGMRNPAVLLKEIQEKRATGFSIVPTGMQLLLRMLCPQTFATCRALKYIELGSTRMPMQTRRELARALPDVEIWHHYGLTEASRACFTEYHRDSERGETIGKASPGLEVTVRDASRNPVIGAAGEIVVKGPGILREYWQDPERTRATIDVHGFWTGDSACLDSDGYLYLEGRRADLINVGGLKVLPEEVEEELRRVPGIEDACCIGIDDQVTGQVVKAYLVASNRPDRVELVRALRDRLEEFKLPRIIQYVKAIPRSQSGKILRQHLIDLADAVKRQAGPSC